MEFVENCAGNRDLIPLSSAQYGMWFADSAHSGAATNIAQYVEIEGPIDVALFNQAVHLACEETESLMVRIVEVDGRPYQLVDRDITFNELVLDFSADADPRAAALEWMRADYTRPVDITQHQLAVTRLLKVGDDRHLWYARAHHLVIDGYGAFNVVSRIGEYYNALSEGREPSRLVAAHLRDIATEEQTYRSSSRFETDRRYWLDKVVGLPAPAGLSGRVARAGTVDEVAARELPADLCALLDRRSAELDASAAQVVVAAFAAFFTRMTGADDVVLSVPMSARVTMKLRNAAAMLANMVPIRFGVDDTTTVSQLVRASVNELVSALRHQRYRFEDLRRESDAIDNSANTFGPVLNILFFDSEIRLGDAMGHYHALTSGALEDLQINLYRTGPDAPLRIELHGNDNLYTQREIDSNADGFLDFLHRFLAVGSDARVVDLPLVTAERERAIIAASAGAPGAAPTETLVDSLARQAHSTPMAEAVTADGDTLTYGELDARSTRLARRLIALGAGPGAVVALALPRGTQVIVAMLAVLKSGAAYLPLDIAHPRERLEYVVGHADPTVVLVDAATRELMPTERALVLEPGDDLDGPTDPITDAERTTALRPDSAAYIIFTSGSTGRPKGVVISHRAAVTYLANSVAALDIHAGDVWTWLHSVAFDYSIWEVFGPLVTGGRLVVVDGSTARSPEELVRLTARERVTVFSHTPSAFYQFAAAQRRYRLAGAPEGAQALRLVVLSGESLDPAALAPWYEDNPVEPLIVNSYGITETTVFVTRADLSVASAVPGAPSVIGAPLPGLRAYVLDRRLRPAPVGAWGEIYVAGGQLARGYLGQPALSAGRFVADPWGAPGERMYRSGDVARRNHDGELEYRGRADQQIQLRGFRIELDEVRAALLTHPAVAAAAVVVHRPDTDAARLVGYVVANGADCDVAAVVAQAGSVLPEYMIPSTVMVLDELPLTVNGKLDLRALPEPAVQATAYVAPRGGTEETVARVFAEVLDVDRIGVHDSFFEVGGNSLTAASAVVRLAEATGCELSVRDLFGHPTVAGFAECVGRARRRARPALVPVPRDGFAPLAPAQQRMWLINRVDPGSAAYNIPLVLRLTGRLDATALRAALGDVLERHEALRTRYPARDGEGVQEILSGATTLDDFPLVPEQVDGAALADRIRELTGEGFDVCVRPPLRAALLTTGPEDHVLVLVLHHICCDGVSLAPLAVDFAAAYAARSQHTAPAQPPLRVQYADYADWHHTLLGDDADPDSTAADHLRYWTQQLADAPALLELPTDRPRPAQRSMRGEIVASHIPARIYAEVEALARAADVTPFMVVHAALAVLLARLSGTGDIVVGAPLAGRGEADLAPLVGMFVNTVALRTPVDGAESFTALLERVKDIDLDAFAHGDLPYDRVVEELDPQRSTAYAPICQVYLSFDNTELPRLTLPDLTVEVLDPGAEPAKVDLVVTIGANAAAGDVSLRINYATDLFDPATVENLAERLCRVLDAVVTDPSVPVGDVDLLSVVEHAVLRPVRGADAVPGIALADLLAKGVAISPSGAAVVSGEERMDFAELDARSNRFARRLLDEGARPGAVVAMVLPRSVDFVVAVWAVAKTGAALVLIDPRNPRDRVRSMLADSMPMVVLTSAEVDGVAPTGPWSLLMVADPVSRAITDGYSAAPVTDAERGRPVHSGDVAYVIYTSGTTGVPKGVEVTNQGLANFAAEQQDRYDVDPGVRVLQAAGPGFDAVMLEILLAHPGGATLIISPPDVYAGKELAELVVDHGVTHAFLTPTVLASMSPKGLDCLQVLVSGGEALTPDLSAAWAPGRRLFNGYGPTETTIMVAISDPVAAQGPITIGGPIRGMSAQVLDARMQPVPVGAAGELYIGGVQLARGYLGRPTVTAASFVADPCGDGTRMYRTGDLVRWTAERSLQYLGRADHQVKIRGQRTELGEIEAVLAQDPSVSHAVVVIRRSEGADRLVGYLIGTEVDPERVRADARDRLPAHMVPDVCMVLDRVPLTASGKLDRSVLPEPVFPHTVADIAPRTPAEQLVAGVYRDVLGAAHVSALDNFFDLGGNSLSATKAAARLSDVFGTDIAVRALFETPTVDALARELASIGLRDNSGDTPGRLVPQPRPERIPLSPAQARMWFLNQFDIAAAVYNVPVVVRVSGPLDVGALRAALADVVERHETLRTRYPDSEAGPWQQILEPDDAPALELILTTEAEVSDQIVRETGVGFDVSAEIPVRLRLLRAGSEQWTVVLTVHHIAIDGSSLAPLAGDLAVAYAARLAGHAPDWAPLPVQYADYTLWRRENLGSPDDPSSVTASQIRYWLAALADLPQMLDLPTDRPRPAVQSYRGATLSATIPAELHRDLVALARRHDSTLFMVTHAAFAILLARLSGTGDIAVGTPVAGRGEPALDPLIGMFVNTLVLRTQVDSGAPFTEMLTRVRDCDLGAFDNAAIPFEQLVEVINPPRSTAHAPLTQVGFSFQNIDVPTLSLGGLTVQADLIEPGVAKYDLHLTLVDTLDQYGAPGDMRVEFGYATDLFDEDTVAPIFERFVTLLRGVVTDPAAPVGDLSLLSPRELDELSVRASGPEAPVDDATIADLFAARVLADPEHTAVIDAASGESLTYGAFGARVNAVARGLIGQGIGPGSLVAVSMRRSVDLLTSLYAIHAAGAAYLPLDPDHPVDRLRAVLATARPDAVLVREAIELPTDAPIWRLSELPTGRANGVAPAPVTDADRIRPLRSDDLAYVIFTSGSTGVPKGVALTHAAVVNQLRWITAQYAIGAADVLLLRTPVTFDLSVWELFTAPTAGAALVVAGTEDHADPAAVVGLIAEHGVSVVDFVPSLLSAFLDSATRADLATVRQVLCIGEALDAATVARLRTVSDARIDNLYGPTEAAVSATAYPIGELDGPTVPIGTPEANVVAHVLDARLRPVPPGVTGELYLGGVQLARGYHARPDLTAAAFVADPLGATPGARLYRTGDLARWDSAGQLRYVGRRDSQVKIRGLRVELGDIEAALRAHRTIGAAVATVQTLAGEQVLVGYAVSEEAIDADELRTFLLGRLPAYMVPAQVIRLDAIPLTANGKIDFRALPAPDAVVTRYRAPSGIAEETIATVLADLVQTPWVGADDNFFALGGNSLLATRALSRIGEVLGVTIPVRAVFEAPTVAELARWVERLREVGSVAGPVAGPRPARIPLSPAQSRMWLLNQLDPESASYVVPLSISLDGELDIAALVAALHDVVQRHESLRTTYPAHDGTPAQVILPADEVVAACDLTVYPVAEHELIPRMAEFFGTGFDVSAGAPLRVALYRLGATAHALALSVHHINCDGFSVAPLAADIIAAYSARRSGAAPQWAPLPVQFADYALWQREQLDADDSAAARDLRYWRTQLAGVPDVLALPTDRPRPLEQSHRGATVHTTLAPEVAERVAALARSAGVTPFMVAHTALAVLLAQLSGSDDIAIGTPYAGRGDRALDGLVGMFVNTLVLRTRVRPDQCFTDLIDLARRTDIEAFDHAAVPFEQLVEVLNPARSTAHSPLFQVMLAYQNMAPAVLELPGLEVAGIDVGADAAICDLLLMITEDRGPRNEVTGMNLRLTYATDLFDEATARRFTDQFARVLDAVTADARTVAGEIDLVDDATRARLVRPHDEVLVHPARTLVDAFDEQVARTPGAVALRVPGGRTLTYGEFDAEVNRLARHLVDLGAGPETTVAVAVHRSIELITAVYAVVKTGAAFVPLDPDHPTARLTHVLEVARPLLVVTTAAAEGALPEQARRVRLDDLDLRAYRSDPIGNRDRRAPLRADNTAYVLFTSGSTGAPKGVALTHAATVHQLAWAQREFPHGTSDVVLHKTPITFDIAVWELFWPLQAGAQIVVAAPDGHRDPAYLSEVIADEKISTVHFVPSMLDVLLEHPGTTRLPSVRYVFPAGEALSQRTATRAQQVFDRAAVVNWYGPAEAEVVTAYRCTADSVAPQNVPIGYPVAGMTAYVLNARLRPVPVGVVGDLYVAGAQLARGYQDRPDLTCGVFLADPFGAPGARLYRTGDLARWTPSGALEFFGRSDFQVKYHGQRVEPGDIEAALRSIDTVARAVALVTEDRITAYVTAAPGAQLDGPQLRRELGRLLPSYLVPGAVMVLDALPLNANGKLDRAALPTASFDDAEEFVAPRTDREAVLAKIVAEIVGADRVSVTADLFDIGVNSLSAAQIAARAEAALRVRVAVRDIFEALTVGALAERIAVRDRYAGVPLVRHHDLVEIPLAAAQRRIWILNQLDPASGAYNIAFAARLTGPLDLAALRGAMVDVVTRHETLRTIYPAREGMPYQLVQDTTAGAADVELVDVEDPTALAHRLRATVDAGFDIATDTPVRARLYRTGTDAYVLVLVVHHIAADGASMAPLARDVFAAYHSRRTGTAPQWPALPVDYADYALWQRELLGAEDHADSLSGRQIAYWQRTLADAPELLALPTDRPRPAVLSMDGASVDFTVAPRLHDAVAALARREGVTVFMVLHAALAILLARTAHTADIAIGTPVSGRGRPELDDLVGMFVNTVVLRTEVGERLSFREFLADLRGTDLAALAHADVPFERLVEVLDRAGSTAYSPLYQVMLGFRNADPTRFALDDIEVEVLDPDVAQAKTDLTVMLNERADGAGIDGEIVYATDLFTAATVTRFAERLVRVLETITARPEVTIEDIDLLSAEETAQLLPAGRPAAVPQRVV
ncbi:amino acid adenylation domain-containing protein, partial [Nocardia lasii]